MSVICIDVVASAVRRRRAAILQMAGRRVAIEGSRAAACPNVLYGGCLRFASEIVNDRESWRQVSEKASRKPRADSLRNRDRLLVAARDVFSAGGPDASLEAVARAAGVGIGTLYRHFPTREALFQAVYRREVDQLVDLAATLAAEAPPMEALRRWLHANIGMVATKKGMLAALAPAAGSGDRALCRFRCTAGPLRQRPDGGGRRRRRDPRRHRAGGRDACRCSACATRASSPAGRTRSFAWWTYSWTACACGPTRRDEGASLFRQSVNHVRDPQTVVPKSCPRAAAASAAPLPCRAAPSRRGTSRSKTGVRRRLGAAACTPAS